MTDDAASPPPDAARTGHRIRRAAIVGYVTGTYVLLRAWGHIPSDRELTVAWIAGLAVVSTVGRSRREAVDTLQSWLPFLAALFLYDFARAVGHWLGRPPAVTPQLAIDRFLGGGRLWTERLQHWLIDPSVGLGRLPVATVEQRLRGDRTTIRWYDVMVSVVYQSHFVVPYLTAGILWRCGRRVWNWYAGTFVAVTFAACAFFAVCATAPPWYAARIGAIDPFPRVLAGRAWSRVGLSFASRIIEKGQSTVNPFAAIPSLHGAEALLVAVFLWRFTWRWMRPLLVAYPLLMCFTLVYTGEHYVIDVLLGWALVGAVLFAGARLRTRRGWAGPWDEPRDRDLGDEVGQAVGPSERIARIVASATRKRTSSSDASG